MILNSNRTVIYGPEHIYSTQEKEIPVARVGLILSGWPRKFVIRKEDVKAV